MKAENLIGKKFGRWTVIDYAPPDIYSGKRHLRWLCRCDCGTVRSVKAQSLKRGASKSCGCYHSELMETVGKVNKTHGMSETRLYRIYKHMRTRCYNPNDIRYSNYGGKGVTICDEWSKFEPFAEWALSHGYDDALSIDRIDVNGDYSPENCRWVSNREQANNRTSNKNYTFNGETHNIAEWADIYSMNYKKLYKRLHVGWDIERALTT